MANISEEGSIKQGSFAKILNYAATFMLFSSDTVNLTFIFSRLKLTAVTNFMKHK